MIDWKALIRDYLHQELIIMSIHLFSTVKTNAHHRGFCHGAEAVDEDVARDVHRRTCG